MAHIIVIDDEADLCATMSEILQQAGHTVTTAGDGAEGIAKHRDHPADLIICDIVMPRKEGIETLLELQRDYPDVKLIAMSGVKMAETYLSIVVHFGVKQTLPKPFSAVTLLHLVTKALA